jgi:small subunit ribosomal protein S6
MVQELGGEVLAHRLWAEQRLAYPINGQRKGTYWLTYFRVDSNRLKEFDRACQLNEAILRKLVLLVDPRLVNVLVDHALGKVPAPRPDLTVNQEEETEATEPDEVEV